MSELEQTINRFSENEQRVQKWVNGGPTEFYTTLDNVQVPSIRKFMEELLARAMLKGYATEQELLATTPTYYMYAKAEDTKVVYFWNGSAWINTGLSEKDLANAYTDLQIAELKKLFAPMYEQVLGSFNINTGERIYLSVQDTNNRGGFHLGSESLGWGSMQLIKHVNFSLEDGAGRTLIRANKSGVWLKDTLLTTGKFKLLDRNKKCSLMQLSNGSIYIPSLVVGKVNDLSASQDSTIKTSRIGSHKYADYIGIISNGQSLSVGTGSVDQLSTQQDYSNVMFASGTIVQATNAYYNSTAFEPLIALPTDTFGQNRSELPVINSANAVSRQISKTGKDANEVKFFATAVGVGGQSIEQLESTYLPNFKKVVTDFKNLCDKLGKTCEVWALPWIQGESNYKYNSGYVFRSADYMFKLQNFMDIASNHVVNTTGQQGTPIVFTYQTGTHLRYEPTSFEIAKAQWNMTKRSDMFCLFAPVYTFTTLTDNIHLPSEMSWLMGEYLGRAIYSTMVAGTGKFRPLEPTSVVWSNTEILIEFYAPCYPIQFSDSICTETVNKGFGIWDNGSLVTDAISAVEIVDYKTVKITLKEPITSASAEICFARGNPGIDTGGGRIAGARGNLVDSQGDYDQVTTPLGNVWKMYNSCVMFSYNRINQFN